MVHDLDLSNKVKRLQGKRDPGTVFTPIPLRWKASADSVVPALRTIRNVGGPSTDLKFDGTARGWVAFKQQMLKWTASQNVGYMLEGGHGICTIFQAASAASAKLKSAILTSKATGTTGTISLDIETYAAKDI